VRALKTGAQDAAVISLHLDLQHSTIGFASHASCALCQLTLLPILLILPTAGSGVVEFETQAEAQKAIDTLNDTELNGRLMFVREFRDE
jgi:hypothetical protein